MVSGSLKPRLLDLFCGAGGAAVGYHRAGFGEIVGVDIAPQKNYPFEFVQGDALEYVLEHGHEFDAIHASPPCQGYSIMHNLPWLKGREYPLLILPVMEILDNLGKPYAVENVMGARHGAKGLKKRGLEEHGLQAGWLCGTMFGMPFYRHRLFATNWFWMQPGHPKHTMNLHPRSERWIYGGEVKGLPGGSAGMDTKPREAYSDSEDKRGLQTWPGRRAEPAGLTVDNPVNSAWRAYHDGNGAQKAGVGVGHAKGWKLAAEAMSIDWMKREELTQAIPPAYTEYIGQALVQNLGCQKDGLI